MHERLLLPRKLSERLYSDQRCNRRHDNNSRYKHINDLLWFGGVQQQPNNKQRRDEHYHQRVMSDQ